MTHHHLVGIVGHILYRLSLGRDLSVMIILRDGRMLRLLSIELLMGHIERRAGTVMSNLYHWMHDMGRRRLVIGYLPWVVVMMMFNSLNLG